MDSSGRFNFHHVGQGLFYSGEIKYGEKQKRIVYDCGTSFEKELLEYEIDEAFRTGDTIDLLMISHFDADHINGLPHLLDRVKRVEFLFMPFVEPEELLFLAVKHQFIPKKRRDEEYVNVISDIKTLWGSEKIKNIILLSESSMKDFPDDTDPSPLGWDGDSEDIVFKFFRDEARQNDFDTSYFPEGKSLNQKVQIAQYDGKFAFWNGWDFKFYVNNEGGEDRRKFHKALAEQGIEVASFTDIQKVIRDKSSLDKLKHSYKKVRKNLNLRSMIVLHKPMKSDGFCTKIEQETPVRCISHFRFSCYPHCMECIGAAYMWGGSTTILLGDGDISGCEELNRMKEYFGDTLAHCAVASLPHHGSRYNWKKEVLNYVESKFWIVSFGIHGKFGHPDTEVLDDFQASWKYVHGYERNISRDVPYLLFCNEYQNVEYWIGKT